MKYTKEAPGKVFIYNYKKYNKEHGIRIVYKKEFAFHGFAIITKGNFCYYVFINEVFVSKAISLKL